MSSLSPKQQKMVKLIHKIAVGKKGDPELMLLQELHVLEEKMDAIKAELTASFKDKVQEIKDITPDLNKLAEDMRGKPGHTPTDAELVALITPLIPQVEDGKPPTKEELLSLIRPLIPVVKNGETPSDARLLDLIEPLIPPPAIVDEARIINEIENKIEQNLPQFGTAIRDALELLNGDNRLKVSAIDGIEAIFADIKTAVKNGGGKIGWGAHPINIQQSGTVKAKGARHINFTGATVTQSASGVTTVAITAGGGFTTLAATETPDGVNTTFTFSTATAQPSFIISDNVMMQATTKKGTVNWTWNAGTKQATLTVAPTDDILAVV